LYLKDIFIVVRRSEILKLVTSFLVLKLSEGLRLDLTDSFPGNTHHLAHFFQSEGSVIAGDPGAITKRLVFQPPLAHVVLAGLGNKDVCFLAFIKVRHSLYTFVFFKYFIASRAIVNINFPLAALLAGPLKGKSQ